MLKRISFLLFSAVTLTAFESTVDYSDPMADRIIAMEHDFEQEQMPCIISQYDNIMRRIAAEHGQDWRLMSAIAYSESRFTEDLVSRQGASGIMQIRPIVARHFNIPVEMIDDVETNIRLACMLLSELDQMLRLPASTPTSDRLSIILASYNAGIGHVMDARRLARLHGENPDSWPTVSRYLELKAEPEYYQSEAVRNGRFTGSRQTNGYVSEVMRKYDQYCALSFP